MKQEEIQSVIVWLQRRIADALIAEEFEPDTYRMLNALLRQAHAEALEVAAPDEEGV